MRSRRNERKLLALREELERVNVCLLAQGIDYETQEQKSPSRPEALGHERQG